MPLVTIIIPTRARPNLLPGAVESVRRQSERDLEILIVDNNPAGPDVVAVNQWCEDPRVRIIPAPAMMNAAGARNAGLAQATGEWVTFLDDDDAYRPEKVWRQLECATLARVPLVTCGAEFHLKNRSRCRTPDGASIPRHELLTAPGGTPMLFHRRCEVRFNETLFAGEDLYYLLELVRLWKLERIPVVREPLLDVYQDEPSRVRTNRRAYDSWQAARRTWWDFRGDYDAKLRRAFLLRSLITRAKLGRRFWPCVRLGVTLLKTGGMRHFRFVANAIVVAAALDRGRFVT
jgi:glycosyltransferase involved in cell wall biosynthesis